MKRTGRTAAALVLAGVIASTSFHQQTQAASAKDFVKVTIPAGLSAVEFLDMYHFTSVNADNAPFVLDAYDYYLYQDGAFQAQVDSWYSENGLSLRNLALDALALIQNNSSLYSTETLEWINTVCAGISIKDPAFPQTAVTLPETPAEPEQPEEPAEPEQPTEPEQPEEPSDPSEPTDPETPETPEEPTDPEEPADPEEPSEPSDPAEPADPEEPTEPEEPAQPAEPDTPADTDTPSDSVTPDTNTPAVSQPSTSTSTNTNNSGTSSSAAATVKPTTSSSAATVSSVSVFDSAPSTSVTSPNFGVVSVSTLSKRENRKISIANLGTFNLLPDYTNSAAWKGSASPYNTPRLWGQCTWFAWGRFYELYGFSPRFYGNGYQCVEQLLAAHPDKFEFSTTPAAGAVFSSDAAHNHVGIVLEYDAKSDILTIQEGNLDGVSNADWNVAIEDYRTVKLSSSDMRALYGNVTYAVPKNGVQMVESNDSADSTVKKVKTLRALAMEKLRGYSTVEPETTVSDEKETATEQ